MPTVMIRNTFILLIIFCIAIKCTAQNSPSLSKPLTNSPFIGNWVWESGKTVFTIKIQSGSVIKNGTTYHILYGWHSYTEKGNLVESSIAYAADTLNNACTIIGNQENDSTYSFIITDLTGKRNFSAKMQLIKPIGLAVIRMRENEVIRVMDTRAYPTIPTLPNNIVMKKE